MDLSISQLRQTGIPLTGVVSIGLLCALHALVPAVHGQDTIPVLVRVEDRTRVGPRDRVVVRDARTGLDHEIYRSQGHIPDQVAVSPDGRYLAFIEVVSQTGAGKRRLTVIERSGRAVRFLGESSIYAARGIREYLWCCGPDKLAVITGGVGGEGAVGESTTLPHGLSLIDVRTGAATPIAGLRFPVQMHWAAFDSSLYIKDSPEAAPGTRGPVAWPVYRYHVPTGTLSRTAHRGVFFSPDGKHYFDAGVYEASRSFALYETANDQDVTARLAMPRHHLGPEGGWMPGADHVLIFTEKPPPQPAKVRQPGDRRFARAETRAPRVFPDRWNVAVDAETGRVNNRFQGDIGVGWKTNARALPVERHAGIELIPPRRP